MVPNARTSESIAQHEVSSFYFLLLLSLPIHTETTEWGTTRQSDFHYSGNGLCRSYDGAAFLDAIAYADAANTNNDNDVYWRGIMQPANADSSEILFHSPAGQWALPQHTKHKGRLNETSKNRKKSHFVNP